MKKLLIASILMTFGFGIQGMAQDYDESVSDEQETTTTETITEETTTWDETGTATGDPATTEAMPAPETTPTEPMMGSEGVTTGQQEASAEQNRWGLEKGGAYLEPMLIFGQNDSELKAQQLAGTTEGTIRDVSIGARLGLHMSEIFFLAADGRYGRSSFDDDFYEAVDAESWNLGGTAGLQTPFYGVRLWGTYIFGGQFNPESGPNDLDLKFTGATGYRVGTGLHVGQVSVNLEFQDLAYDSTEIESLGSLTEGSLTAGQVDASQTGYSLSLGFPFTL